MATASNRQENVGEENQPSIRFLFSSPTFSSRVACVAKCYLEGETCWKTGLFSFISYSPFALPTWIPNEGIEIECTLLVSNALKPAKHTNPTNSTTSLKRASRCSFVTT